MLCRRGGVTVKLTVKMALMNKTVVSIAIGYLYRQKPLRKSFTCTNCLMTMKEIMRSGCFFLYVCYCQYATRQLRKEQSYLVGKALYVPLRTSVRLRLALIRVTGGVKQGIQPNLLLSTSQVPLYTWARAIVNSC